MEATLAETICQALCMYSMSNPHKVRRAFLNTFLQY
jgi:hypothetical protein